jgi:hypothetical protein
MKLEKYDEVIAYLKKQSGRKLHLLMGNGFSIAYDSKMFSYNALSKFVKSTDNEVLKALFTVVNNTNFEVIMQQLDSFIKIADVFECSDITIDKIKDASVSLQNSLIEAVKELHPEYVFKIPDDKSKKCASFLYEYINNGGYIFTTNYDLLMYWVLMRNKSDQISIDGFGRDAENIGDEYVPPEEIEYSELRWGKHRNIQNTFYLHGALPLFDTGIEIIKEEYDGVNYLLENIKNRIDNKEYPIFVTAGNGKEKLNHIMHNKYLSYCYEALTQIEGSLITYGFNFGDYDEHIIDAINRAAKNGRRVGNKLLSIYIGVYSDDDIKHIEAIENKFKCKVHIFDSKTANIW